MKKCLMCPNLVADNRKTCSHKCLCLLRAQSAQKSRFNSPWNKPYLTQKSNYTYESREYPQK